MKTLLINNKEYKIEFTFEASLYNECIETTIDLITALSSKEDGKTIKDAIKSMAGIPNATLIMFYAGLLENHSDEVKSIDDAKKLAKAYMTENKDKEEGTFIGLMSLLMEAMADDGFFNQIGLDKLVEATQEVKPEKKRK